MRLPFVVALLIASSACGPLEAPSHPVAAPALGTSRHEAKINPAQVDLALAVVASTQDYIPYGYQVDGCYARALYMSMELAAREIPSSAQYIDGRLAPNAFIRWAWHVAPMVEIIGTKGRTILDPALSPEGPVTLDEWVRLTNPSGSHRLTWTLGSEYFDDGNVKRNDQEEPVIESFAELKPFRQVDVAKACSTMVRYLSLEDTTPEVMQRKTDLLLRRTRTLVDRLEAVSKFEALSPARPVSCAGNTLPVCAEPAAECETDTDCCSMTCMSGVCQAREVDLLADVEPGSAERENPRAGDARTSPAPSGPFAGTTQTR